MTVSEQANIFDQQVELKMELDEMHDELVMAKAAAAKAMWEREHERLYQKSRNRILFNILSGPLSVADREQVVEILMETEGSSSDDDDDQDGANGANGANGGGDGSVDGATAGSVGNSSRGRTKIYDVAAPGDPLLAAANANANGSAGASASLVANNSNAAAAEASAGVSMIDGRAIVALYAYTGTNVDEIDLVVDEPLTILNAPDNDEGWITVQNAAGMQGVVPEAYVGPDDGVGAEDGGDDGDDGDFVVVNDAPVAVVLPVPAYAPVSALDADALARAAEAQAPKPPT